MSKTKFIKVSGKEIPEQAGTYNTSHGVLNYSKALNEFLNEKGESVLIESWFEEVPDREEEIREMLEKARTVIARLKRSMLVHPDHEEGSEFDDLTTSAQDMENEIEQLLNK